MTSTAELTNRVMLEREWEAQTLHSSPEALTTRIQGLTADLDGLENDLKHLRSRGFTATAAEWREKRTLKQAEVAFLRRRRRTVITGTLERALDASRAQQVVIDGLTTRLRAEVDLRQAYLSRAEELARVLLADPD